MTYVRLGSWHTLALTYRSGLVKTRCGLVARVEGTLASGPGIPVKVSPTAAYLPPDDKTCETCLRLGIVEGSVRIRLLATIACPKCHGTGTYRGQPCAKIRNPTVPSR